MDLLQPDLPEWTNEALPNSVPCRCDETTPETECPRCVLENPMTKSEYSPEQISALLLHIRDLQEQLGEAQSIVVNHVLATRRSVKAPGVQCLYLKPRRSFDYESVGRKADATLIKKHTTTTVDWRKVALTNHTQDDIPFTESEPRASIRFKESDQ